MIKRVERQFAGRTLSIETGRMARLAQGSCLVQFGDTVVLVATTVQDKPSHLPFFPLTIEFQERSYSAGKIPGGFFKREGRPSENAILSCRLTDRPLRPLFPEGFKHPRNAVTIPIQLGRFRVTGPSRLQTGFNFAQAGGPRHPGR